MSEISKIFEQVIKSGTLNIIECLNLKLLNRFYCHKFRNREEILQLVVINHCTQGKKKVNPWECLKIKDHAIQFKFWKNYLMTAEVKNSLFEMYGVNFSPDSPPEQIQFYSTLAMASSGNLFIHSFIHSFVFLT